MGYELEQRASTASAPASPAGVASPGKQTLVQQSYGQDDDQAPGPQCDATGDTADRAERQLLSPRRGIQQLFGRPVRAASAASKDGTTTLQAATSIEQFKHMVKDAGRLRMDGNKARLEEWKALIAGKLTGDQVASQVMATRANQLGTMAANEGGMAMATFDDWAKTDNPLLAWVKEQQIEGRYRACAGCHETVRATEQGQQRSASAPPAASPMATLQSRAQVEAAGPMPRPSSAVGDAMPDANEFRGNAGAAQAMQAVRAIRPYLEVLGPARYDILPADVFTTASSGDELRAKILAGINRRQADYELFKAKIASPGFDYLLLHPIVQDLLPLASPEVQRAVQDEISHARSWSVVKAIAVGVATIGALVLTIFPPTSALGVAALTGLEASLASYGVVEGIGMAQEGALLANGRGANDVIDPEQQKSADMMMAMGVLSVGMSALALPSVGFKTVTLMRGPVEGAALSKVTAIEAQLADGGSVKITELAGASPKIVVLDKDGKLLADGTLTDRVLTGKPTTLDQLPANGVKGATPRAGTPERPVSFQGKGLTCGPVACEMVASMAGPVDPALLQRMLAEAGPAGADSEQMVMMLKWNKIVAEAKSGWKVKDLAAATEGGNPAIAMIMTANRTHRLHFVVIDGVTVRNGVRVVAIRNPWGVQYFQSESEFAKIFNGRAIAVSHWTK